MRFKGKKPIFNIADTFSLDDTLSPILYEGLKKFKEVLEEKDREDGCFGVPTRVYEKEGIDVHSEDKEDSDKAVKAWFDILDQMIYAFDPKSEPDSSQYDFDIECKEIEDDQERVRYTMEVSNEESYEKYHQDLKEHDEKCKVGRELFAEFLNGLWH